MHKNLLVERSQQTEEGNWLKAVWSGNPVDLAYSSKAEANPPLNFVNKAYLVLVQMSSCLKASKNRTQTSS
jgi:hypothetical protein